MNAKDFLKANTGHILGIGLCIGAVIGFHSWLAEHDARLVSDGQVKTAEATVTALRANQTATATAARVQIVTLKAEAARVTTPKAALADIPRVSTVDLHPEALPAPGEPPLDAPNKIAVDAVPLDHELNDAAITAVDLAACLSESKDEKGVTTAKDAEIKALKSKGRFWVRVRDTAITAGIGAAIGYAAHR